MSRLKGGSRPLSTERAPPTSTRNTLPNSSSKAIACRSGISRRLAMANLRPRFLQRLLASALLISAAPALALQTIEARDGVSVEAAIALKEATRIKVDGANITEVFGNIYSSNCGAVAAVNRDSGQSLAATNPAGEIVLECDKDKGEIYVKPVSAGAKPINLFISTSKSTYTLILKRVDMPADTIVVKDRTIQQATHPFERAGGTSPSHVRALK